MNWFHSLLYGFIMGLADILPVSSQAHSTLLLSLIGDDRVTPLMRLLVHFAILGALYYSCQNQIIRIARAVRLSRIPKRRRKRPLDTKSLMELSMLKTMAVPVVIGFFFYSKASVFQNNLVALALLLLVNGIVLYVPQFLPGGNKDARNMSPVEAFLMGVGGGASVLPGISAVGASGSIATAMGADRTFALNMALLLNMGVMIGTIVMDIVSMVSTGLGTIGLMPILYCLMAAAAAFGGAVLAVQLLRKLIGRMGLGIFAYYCWGAALFSFILYISI